MSIAIREHHQRAIDKMIDRFGRDPAFCAMLVAGSVARGVARDDSDVDLMLVATDAEYARRKASGQVTFCLWDVTDYPGGYIDCKVLDLAFLKDAAEKGSEPTRHAFIGAYAAFSHIDGLENLLQQIPVYPTELQQDRINSFRAQVSLNKWFFFGEALRRNDSYLLTRSASDIVLFAGRMILAHNSMLFPCHKRLMEYVEMAPEKPADFVPLARKLLAEPTGANMEAVCKCIETFRDWNVKTDDLTRYTDDAELSWRTGRMAISDV